MKKIIGIIGPVAAGKDTAAEYLAGKWNIPIFEISAHLKELARSRGIEVNRKNLIELGRELDKGRGHAHLAEKIINKLSEVRINLAIITGMRQLAQIEYLREYSNLLLIAVDASHEVRFERATARGKFGEGETLEQFIANEQEENSGPVQQLFECMKLADCHIVNSGNLQILERSLDVVTIPFLQKGQV